MKAARSTAATTPARTSRRVNDDDEIAQRGDDLISLAVDPHDPQTVYLTNTSTYRSTDGGKTLVAIKGAPGGDDYHTVWINPRDPKIIALASDQGATISRRRRRDVEFVVQPADRADVPRQRRRPLSVLGLRRTAGERFGLRRQPRQLGSDHASAIGIPSARKSTATSCPIRCTRASSTAARSRSSTSAPDQTQEVSPIALSVQAVSHRAHRAARLRSLRPAAAILRRQRRVRHAKTAVRAGARSAPTSRARIPVFRR